MLFLMFTGLIDDVGVIEHVSESAAGLELRIRCGYTSLEEGESIAVNGACLTVREFGPNWFQVAAASTTLPRTSIGSWKAGDRVNLERSMRLGDRLGGHIVQGHVDSVGRVIGLREHEDALLVDIEIDPELHQLMVPRGSITVDGVSLTINEIPVKNVIQVSIIEYTRRHTIFDTYKVGSEVHIEGDIIGKFVRQLVAPYLEANI